MRTIGRDEFAWGGTAALAVSVLCWASIPVLLRDLTSSIDAWTANGFRYPLAALLYWPALRAGYRAGVVDRRLLLRACIPAALCLGGQVLFALTPYYLPASSIGFLVQASVVWSLAGAMVVFADERALLARGPFYVGLVLAAGGYIALAAARGALEQRLTGAGALIMLGCTLFFGSYAVGLRYYLSEVPALAGFGVVAQYVSLATLGLMFLCGRPQELARLSLRGWAFLVASSLLGIAVAHVLFYVAVQRLGVSIASGVNLVSPFLTLGLAWLVLGETMTGQECAAGTAMVIGAGLLLLTQQRLR